MGGIHAGMIVAAMADVHTRCRPAPMSEIPRDDMCAFFQLRFRHIENAIAIVSCPSLPWPTLIWSTNEHLCPKPLRKGTRKTPCCNATRTTVCGAIASLETTGQRAGIRLKRLSTRWIVAEQGDAGSASFDAP